MRKSKQKIHIEVDENDIAFCYLWLEKYHPVLKLKIKYRVDFDFEDKAFVESQCWFIHDWGYAFFPISLNGMPVKSIYMHRQIAQHLLQDEQMLDEVDHLDWNKLNNRRKNLRIVNRQENMNNMPPKCPFGRHYIQTIHSNLYYAYAPNGEEPAIFLGEFPSRSEAIQAQLTYKENNKEVI